MDDEEEEDGDGVDVLRNCVIMGYREYEPMPLPCIHICKYVIYLYVYVRMSESLSVCLYV